MMMPIAASAPDARMSEQDFRSALINIGALPDHGDSYPRDFHFKQHGFDFIETEADIDVFMQDLDAAGAAAGSSCNKARSIRFHMDSPWKGFTKIGHFKAAAADARRTHCRCHLKCSFAVDKRSAPAQLQQRTEPVL